MTKLPWQYVALAVVGAAFFLGVLALIPADQPELRTGLLGLLVLAGQSAVARWIVGKVSSDMNDKADKAIRRIEVRLARIERQVGVSRETWADVSRETKRGRRR